MEDKKAETTQKRPGRQTSEFWVTVILALALVGGAGYGFFAGKLEYTKALEVLGIGLGVLGLGYNVARGAAKQGPLKSILIIFAISALVTLSACGSTFRSVLVGMHKGAKAISAVYEPPLQVMCVRRAAACKGKVTDMEQCKPYVVCRDIQRDIAAGMKLAHKGIGMVDKAHKAGVAAGLIGDGS